MGVKSFGCENRIAQPSPIHSCKRMRPWVVSAVKSGAVSPMPSDIIMTVSLQCGGEGAAEGIRGKGVPFRIVLPPLGEIHVDAVEVQRDRNGVGIVVQAVDRRAPPSHD